MLSKAPISANDSEVPSSHSSVNVFADRCFKLLEISGLNLGVWNNRTIEIKALQYEYIQLTWCACWNQAGERFILPGYGSHSPGRL
jgi:hypothetical protein